MGKKKKRNENKKNKTRPIIKKVLLGILLLNIIVLSLLIYKRYNINKHFSKYMLTTNNISLYKKENMHYQKIGKVYKGNIVVLEKVKNSYYKTKDGYYIKHSNLKKVNKPSQETYNGIPFNKNIILKNNSIVYKKNKKYFKLNKSPELKLLEKGDKYYKVLYNKEIVEIKKTDIKKEIDKKNTTKESITHIPVLYLDNMTQEKITEVLEYLSSEKYQTLTEDDYILWTKDYKNIGTKSVYLILEQDSLKELLKKYKMNYTLRKELKVSFIENDAHSEKDKPYWYTVNQYMTLDRIKDILNNIKLDENEYAKKIAVLNYHFFYDETKESCNEAICLKKSIFNEQMKYLKDNNIKSITMEEYYKWLIGEINLPKKSVLLTVDDGAMGTNNILPDILDEYNQKATLFLITSFWNMSKYRIGNLEIQSHSHSLHDRNFCKDNICDIKTFVLSKEEIKQDLKKSKEIIGNPIAYCYPFYKYDDKTIEAVKEEFLLAFAGGNRKSTRNDNHYLIPRYVILDDITIEDFKSMIE